MALIKLGIAFVFLIAVICLTQSCKQTVHTGTQTKTVSYTNGRIQCDVEIGSHKPMGVMLVRGDWREYVQEPLQSSVHYLDYDENSNNWYSDSTQMDVMMSTIEIVNSKNIASDVIVNDKLDNGRLIRSFSMEIPSEELRNSIQSGEVFLVIPCYPMPHGNADSHIGTRHWSLAARIELSG